MASLCALLVFNRTGLLYFLCAYALLEALKYLVGIFISVRSPDMLQENIGRTIVILIILNICQKRNIKGKSTAVCFVTCCDGVTAEGSEGDIYQFSDYNQQ